MASGGGGGGSQQFKAQGTPPGFDYNSANALNQMAIGGDIQSYALSDADFANRYPALQNAYQQWQANLGNQVGAAGAAQGGLQSVMGGLANQISGRQGTPTTSDINNIRNAASTVGGAAQPIMNLAQPQVQMGAQQGAIGGQLAGMGQQVAGMAATPYALGQQLLQEPIDPQTQQQMMRAGLGTTLGAGLGAASLGQGMAGQSAAARQLGLNTLQYGQAMRGEAMGDISQAASIMGQGGQLSGLGAQTIGAGAGTIGQGAQTLGLGANVAGQAGQLSSAAQQAQEQYQMDTSQMANTYGTLQNQQAMNLMLNMQTAGNMFQKRPFGMGGTNMAQTELGQAGAYNSFQQANYATMNGIAFNSAQLNAQNQQAAAQQQSAQTGALISAGSTAAVVGATAAGAACWVARAAFGEDSPKWRIFRHWLMNKAPRALRRAYLVYGPSFAPKVRANRLLGALVRRLMDLAINQTTYVCLPA